MPTVTIVYPTDPRGIVPGGTDTCIRDILRYAPPDITMKLVGVTTDPVARPRGKWTTCHIDDTTYEFFPTLSVGSLDQQQRIPLSAKFAVSVVGRRLWTDCDVIQFNRIEPAFPLLSLPQKKLLIIHQNMNVLNDKRSDIRWKHIPGLYFRLENRVIDRMKQIYIVREDAVECYRKRFAERAQHIDFLPTWMNPRMFYYDTGCDREHQRREIASTFSFAASLPVAVFVGRLDSQKDPLLLIDAFARVIGSGYKSNLLLIGDGVLRNQVSDRIRDRGLTGHVRLAGALPQDLVARYLRQGDLMVLSSAYEGMPRCVVEAMGCGLPVVAMNVGEVARLVENGRNGRIVYEHNAEAFAEAIETVMDNLDTLSGDPCVAAVADFQAEKVLGKLYDCYRRLA